MRFSGYILDVEGTLVDCVPETLLSWQEALLRVGLRVPYDVLQLYSGLDGSQTLDLVAPQLSKKDRTSVLKLRGLIYDNLYLRSVKAFPRARETVLAMARYGKVALATDCKGAALRHYLSLLNIDSSVTAIVCGDDVDHGKPDPRLIGIALRKLGLPASKVIMIGDTPYDVEAARSAGTAAAGVLTGGFTAKVFADAGCVLVASQLHGLFDRLEIGEHAA